MGLEEASGKVYVADIIAGDVTAPFLVWFGLFRHHYSSTRRLCKQLHSREEHKAVSLLANTCEKQVGCKELLS